MAGLAFKCPGCSGRVKVAALNPGEDDTVPWNVCVPHGHTVLSNSRKGVRYDCPGGELPEYFVDPRTQAITGSRTDKVPDRVDHETWIEYYDRLVKEYYDFDAEWALIKEICPELEKMAPVLKQPLPKHVRQARAWAVGFAIWAVVAFTVLDWTSTAVVATVWALVFASMYRRWSAKPRGASRPHAAAPRRPGGTL